MHELCNVGGDACFVNISSQDCVGKGGVAPSGLSDEPSATEDAAQLGEERNVDQFFDSAQPEQRVGRQW